ncbi:MULTISPECIES: peptide-methionine (R)-S-oxide reductase MsrB [Sphingobium]|uniref:peptide-methionine (R)-S-oxide reductase n=1 Tax=Sphingobium chungbukense TaxID=56193 RepID=A0A0M3AUB1_9SPHN|nr:MULTISPECIES: peptide-methionine (R)-S-oxide reductase MsrB [Sphingobium]KKW93762.1 methionine sulfoxide reductase B [Sphingobium chungbukense]PJG48239.1 peptide-methionine (R)-S-oxide reductase [Sphingobium sp. LB126]
MDRRQFLGAGGLAAATAVFGLWGSSGAAKAYAFTLSDAEWRKRLSPLAYNVLRHQATEYPFTSPLNKEHRAGIFTCAGCGQRLFSSKTKFDSGTGWPSFWSPLPGAVGTSRDFELGYPRTEVHCGRCGGHLGHVFDDGPKPTGKRYCMNGVALAFVPG